MVHAENNNSENGPSNYRSKLFIPWNDSLSNINLTFWKIQKLGDENFSRCSLQNYINIWLSESIKNAMNHKDDERKLLSNESSLVKIGLDDMTQCCRRNKRNVAQKCPLWISCPATQQLIDIGANREIARIISLSAELRMSFSKSSNSQNTSVLELRQGSELDVCGNSKPDLCHNVKSVTLISIPFSFSALTYCWRSYELPSL